jgi:hypothetical protein
MCNEHEPVNLIDLLPQILERCEGWLQEAKGIDADKEVSPTFRTDAINWGDLHAVNAELCIDAMGKRRFVVTVSEAEPSSVNLGRWLSGKVAESEFNAYQIDFVFEY